MKNLTIAFRLRKEIDECKERIVSLKELNGAKSSYNYDFFNDDMLPEDNNTSQFSPASTTCSERIRSCIAKPQEAGPKANNNNKFKRRLPQPKAKTLSNGSHFVRASDFMNNIENHTEMHNTGELHFGASNTTVANVSIILFLSNLYIYCCCTLNVKSFFHFQNEPKKKFVFKERSAITQKQKR